MSLAKASPIPLAERINQAVTFQSYESQPGIKDVFTVRLKKHRALEGWFMEYFRMSEAKIENFPLKIDVRQISFSKATPGRINAFHIHPKQIQDELWCVIDGTLLVWLVDCRADSPTLGVKCRYMLSAEEPVLLHIPSGVAHGYKAGPEGALLVYAMNSQFDASDPNEGRLPWDFFGAELWREDHG